MTKKKAIKDLDRWSVSASRINDDLSSLPVLILSRQTTEQQGDESRWQTPQWSLELELPRFEDLNSVDNQTTLGQRV